MLTVVLSLLLASDLPKSQPTPLKNQNRAESGRPEPLLFNELFQSGRRELEPSPKLLALNGKRVKMVGYMVLMELAPPGAVYLAPTPVFCDEAGGGTADLPPDAVRVIVRSKQGKKVDHIPRLIEVTGILEIGNRLEEDGQVSAIRLVLDRAKDRQARTKTNQTKTKSERDSKSPIATKREGTAI